MEKEKKEINAKTIARHTDCYVFMTVGMFFMVVVGLAMIGVGYVAIRDFNPNDEGAILNLMFSLVLEFGFLGGIFFYFIGVRNFRKGHRMYKDIRDGLYTVRKEMVTSTSTYRDSDNDERTVFHFSGTKETYLSGGYHSFSRGEQVYLIFSPSKSLITVLSMKKYYLPGHEFEEPEAVVEINGQEVVVGEQEEKEEKAVKEAQKFITPLFIASIVVGIVVGCFFKAEGCGFFSGIAFFFLSLGVIGNLSGFEMKYKGKPVTVTVSEIKAYDGWEETVYTFDYNGQTITQAKPEEGKRTVGYSYEAYYVPKNGHLYVMERGQKKKNDSCAPIYIIALIFLIPAVICGFFGV